MSDPIHQPPRFGRIGPQDGGLQPLQRYLEQERQRWRPLWAVDPAGDNTLTRLISRDPNPQTHTDPAGATGYQVETVLVSIDPLPDPFPVARTMVEEAIAAAKAQADDDPGPNLTRLYRRQVARRAARGVDPLTEAKDRLAHVEATLVQARQLGIAPGPDVAALHRLLAQQVLAAYRLPPALAQPDAGGRDPASYPDWHFFNRGPIPDPFAHRPVGYQGLLAMAAGIDQAALGPGYTHVFTRSPIIDPGALITPTIGPAMRRSGRTAIRHDLDAGPRHPNGSVVLYRGKTYTVERSWRVLSAWRYTIDGPAELLDVDEPELTPVLE